MASAFLLAKLKKDLDFSSGERPTLPVCARKMKDTRTPSLLLLTEASGGNERFSVAWYSFLTAPHNLISQPLRTRRALPHPNHSPICPDLTLLLSLNWSAPLPFHKAQRPNLGPHFTLYSPLRCSCSGGRVRVGQATGWAGTRPDQPPYENPHQGDRGGHRSLHRSLLRSVPS